MNKLLTLALGLFLLSSCEKSPVGEEPPVDNHPRMQYTDLQNFEVKPGTFKRVDLDGNGTNDLLFKTLLVGDALGQRDRLQFYAHTGIGIYQPVNELEEVPQLSTGEAVKVQFPGYTWYEITAIVLAEKITPVSGSVHWEGPWKAASHKFLPVMVEREGKAYYGWVELSFDTASEKMTLHRAAISTEAGREVIAGR
ncbi:MAG TPA: hypothetical protein VGE66_17420 [Chitinophagaceae bacterium]